MPVLTSKESNPHYVEPGRTAHVTLMGGINHSSGQWLVQAACGIRLKAVKDYQLRQSQGRPFITTDRLSSGEKGTRLINHFRKKIEEEKEEKEKEEEKTLPRMKRPDATKTCDKSIHKLDDGV